MQKPRLSELIFFWILLAGAGVLSYLIFAPYFTPIFLGLVLAIVLFPVHVRLSRALKGRASLSAVFTTLGALFAILVPLFFIGLLLTQETVSAYNSLAQNGGFIAGLTQHVNALIHRVLPNSTMEVDLASHVEAVLSYIGVNLNTVFMSAAGILFSALLMLFALFFFLRDGLKLRRFIMEWSPLSDKYDENIMERLSTSVAAVVKGTLVSATAQGIAVGLGFLVFRVPGALLWGMLSVFAALIPLVGTGVISFPAALYLMLTGHVLLGIGLALYALVIIGNIDTILRPALTAKSLNLHPFVILLSVLGGLSVFGPVGFIVGPVVITLLFVLLDLYPELSQGKVEAVE